MFFGPALMAVPAAFLLAATPGAQGFSCRVPQPPAVSVKVTTDEIDYDFTKSAKELSGLKSDTVSPYAPGADTVSGGLREDHPTIKTEISWEIKYDRNKTIACLWYSGITINIHLDPKIYIAREFYTGDCRAAVLGHEHRHVDTDHIVMNKYAKLIGVAVKQAVDKAGVLGPFSYRDVEEMQDMSSRHIESAVDSQKLLMEKEMHSLQGKIDSLEEYKKISAICKDVKFP